MALTPEDIESKKFLVGLRGYDKDEVTAFLQEVATDYRSALDGDGAAPSSNGARPRPRPSGHRGRRPRPGPRRRSRRPRARPRC